MRTAQEIFNEQFAEMRWRCLSLAADLDRVDRAGEISDDRLSKLRHAIEVLLTKESNRAAQVQMIFSDRSDLPSLCAGETPTLRK